MRFNLTALLKPLVLSYLLLSSLLVFWLSGERPAYAAPGDVYCVTPGGGTFAACTQVFTSIQAAVDATVGGETIWVAGGIYSGVQTRAGLQQSVYVSRSVIIRGGYVVPFTAPPNPVANATIVDATGQGRVFYVTSPISVTLEGLEITGGTADGLGGSSNADAGGGIYAVEATITLSGNIIHDNIASESDTGFGGGVFLSRTDADLLTNAIHDNLGSSVNRGSGGGIYVEQSRVTIAGNRLIQNTAAITSPNSSLGGDGGGLTIVDSVITVTNNLILSNTALISGSAAMGINSPLGFGGGLSVAGSQGMVLGNTIRANLAHAIGNGYGGGISAIAGPEPISISQNLIEGNIASRGGLGDGNGGGIWLSGQGVIRVEDNLIRANIAAITGVVSLGGGLYMQTAPVSGTLDLSLIGNTIQQNIAALNANIGGGGGLFLCCQVMMAGNTIISNTALVTSTGVLTGQNILGGIGGGIFLEGAQVQSAGDLIRGNSASWGGGGYVELSQYAATNGVIRDNTSPTAAPGLVIGLNSRVELLHLTIAHNTGGVGNAILLTDVSIAPGTGPEPSSLSLTNTILADHLLGISVVGANSVTANGLLWFNTPLRVTAGPAAVVSIVNDYIGDPAFASDGYHLTAQSAAINRGVQAGLVVDLEGEPRNHRPDLGADEYPGLINELFLSLIER